jgi:cyclic beta-1,2-glucan synthetase
MAPEEQTLFRAAARAEMVAEDGNLREQLTTTQVPQEPEAPHLTAVAAQNPPSSVAPARTSPPADRELEYFNGNGGFAADGREYVVTVNAEGRAQHEPGTVPPAPWVNVVANPVFGFAASECGTGFTWSSNSHDNRLTPWSNDPVRDPAGEAVYIRDEESGDTWSATPLPAGQGGTYVTRHRPGSTSYEHRRRGLESTLTIFVPRHERVKIFHLRLRNESARRKRYAVTLYVDWVLGEHRTGSRAHVVTQRDLATGALFARNRFRIDFSDRTAFIDLWPGDARSVTGDRTEFIGRNGTLARPSALSRVSLSDRAGAALDPCGAVQVHVALDPGAERTIAGLLGDADSDHDARAIVERYRQAGAASAALDEATAYWNSLTGTLQVRTPDRAFDLMLNTWLPYQTLACRIQGRSAFYQSSGAYGFRDQLQDVLALIPAVPDLTREHLLRAAARQFVEGDVQHWWHEPSGRGVRTRFADDRLWLPYATLHYVRTTGDHAVLDERVPYLAGRPLEPDEHEAYEQPEVSHVVESLYDHCVRAIALNLPTGPHGLPLMGGGDWNDGMNMVGIEGKGESVWLAWFLMSILGPFADLAASRRDDDLARTYRHHIEVLTGAVEQAWDGDWYRRAYFDDGTAMGSAGNAECRIDAIAQSWAVIAGAGDNARAARAMESVDQHLVRRAERLILLLTPPFDRSQPSPGYIQGYLPGVRENGGQYTHASLWTVLAYALLGDGDRAAELFSLINPINHTRTPEGVHRYRVEPYVVAADVYSRPPHSGRGGWTWYTGSAGWMYRVGLEAILGLKLRGGSLEVDPCIPRAWDGYDIFFKAPRAEYRIAVENPRHVSRGVSSIELDGSVISGPVPVLEDERRHDVRIVLG